MKKTKQECLEVPQNVVKRDYKSRMFTMIFSGKKELLELYNAVSGRHYDDPELLTITTLENAIYMSVKNDISFIVDSRLSLYEHQSTFNPNMPLRFLLYQADLYSVLTRGKNLYGKKKILIPPPKFIVFYNGMDERPDYEILQLSDSYELGDENVNLELKVAVLNINHGHNKELLESCRTLRDYAEYIFRVRKYAENMPIEEAVEQTITECIREDVLREFLEKNRTEAKAVSIYEYNEEEHMRMEREDSYADGCVHMLLLLLEEKGLLTDDLKKRIENEKDIDLLKRWFQKAISAETIEAFMSNIV